MICALLMRIRCVTGGEENLCAQVSEGGKAKGKHSPINFEGKNAAVKHSRLHNVNESAHALNEGFLVGSKKIAKILTGVLTCFLIKPKYS